MTVDGMERIKTQLSGEEPNHLLKPILQGAQAPRFVRRTLSTGLKTLGQAGAAWMVQQGGRRSAKEFWDIVEGDDGV